MSTAVTPKLADFKPDLVISIRFGQIFCACNLDSETRNYQPPLRSTSAYKGVMASFWSLLNSESHLGTTLHWVTDSKIDSGRVISVAIRQFRQTSLQRASPCALRESMQT